MLKMTLQHRENSKVFRIIHLFATYTSVAYVASNVQRRIRRSGIAHQRSTRKLQAVLHMLIKPSVQKDQTYFRKKSCLLVAHDHDHPYTSHEWNYSSCSRSSGNSNHSSSLSQTSCRFLFQVFAMVATHFMQNP